MKLTKAQIRNLQHVRDHGNAFPRSSAGHACRRRSLSEFIFELGDGTVISSGEIDLEYAETPRPIPEERSIQRIVGEQLTEAGRLALAEAERGDPQ